MPRPPSPPHPIDLVRACQHADLPALMVALRGEFPMNQRDEMDRTYAHLFFEGVREHGHRRGLPIMVEALEALLAAGVPVPCKDNQGRTLLHWWGRTLCVPVTSSNPDRDTAFVDRLTRRLIQGGCAPYGRVLAPSTGGPTGRMEGASFLDLMVGYPGNAPDMVQRQLTVIEVLQEGEPPRPGHLARARGACANSLVRERLLAWEEDIRLQMALPDTPSSTPPRPRL